MIIIFKQKRTILSNSVLMKYLILIRYNVNKNTIVDY